jgi:hypothetical protein
MNLLTNEIAKLKDDLYFFINKKFEQESEDENIELKVSFLLNSILALASISKEHEKIILNFYSEDPEIQSLISSAVRSKNCSCKKIIGDHIYKKPKKALDAVLSFLKKDNLEEIQKIQIIKNKCLSYY